MVVLPLNKSKGTTLVNKNNLSKKGHFSLMHCGFLCAIAVCLRTVTLLLSVNLAYTLFYGPRYNYFHCIFYCHVLLSLHMTLETVLYATLC